MATQRINIKLKCLKCGGTPFVEEDHPTDASIVKCKSCGEIFGTFREVKAKAADEARGWMQTKIDAIKSAFKR